MDFTDTLIIDAPRRTPSGYLAASVRAARTGIQIYSGREVDPDNTHGMRDRAQVRVFRSETEVFNKDSLATLAHKPVTINHPPTAVTADNWREYAVGNVGDEIARDGDFVRVPIAIMDGKAITAIEAGKNQLSCGYSCDLVFGDGTSPSGEQYDAMQTGIRYNHLSAVDLARGGDKLKIGDDQMPEIKLTQIVRDGVPVDVNDAAKIVIDGLDAKIKSANETIAVRDTSIATLTTQNATKDAEIVTLKAQVADATITPEKLRAAAKSYADTVTAAKVIAPTATITDAMDETAVKKLVVTAKLGDVAKDWNEAQIGASFASLSANLGDALTNAFKTVKDAAPVTQDAAYNQSVTDLNAWRTQA